MPQQRYDVYFAGEVIDGVPVAEVRERLGRLFKADSATLERLFSGTEQPVKRDCDSKTALRYREAMERAGARPIVRLREEPGSGNVLGLCPPGSEVLRKEERRSPEVAAVTVPTLALCAMGENLSTPLSEPTRAPDTSHLTLGAAGENLPTLPPREQPLHPDTGGLSLAPAGTDFRDCARPAAQPPVLDLSSLELAPPRTPVQDLSQMRMLRTVSIPRTSHIKLAE